MGRPAVDHTGSVFGAWTLTRRIDAARYQARCVCGEERSVLIANLRSGASTSCGCQGVRKRGVKPSWRYFAEEGIRAPMHALVSNEGWIRYVVFTPWVDNKAELIFETTDIREARAWLAEHCASPES